MATNLSSLSDREFELLAEQLDRHTGLNQVISWAAAQPKEHVHPQFVADVITQDEFTHDVIVPFQNVFLVYDTT
jgi:hypothetical protein